MSELTDSSWRADLHTHTTASDGLETPSQLIASAAGAGLQAIAIADHDTVAAHLRLENQDNLGVQVIPAIEMSANVGTAEVHVLGYFIDVHSTVLAEELTELQRQRIVRIERFCQRLTGLGLPITLDDVHAEVTGESIGRPHIARAMIVKGYVTSVGEAFDHYLSGGRKAFVPREDVTPESAIDLIHRAGGAAVLAHPYTTGNPEQMVERLKRAGLDGMEVEYGTYDPTQRTWLRSVADRFALIATGGSDFHGKEHREDASLGSGWVSVEVVTKLDDTARRYH